MSRLTVWLVAVIFCFGVFFFVSPKIETNIFELISDARFDLVKQSVKGNVVRIFFSGDERALQASKVFRDKIQLPVREFPDVESQLQELSAGNLLSPAQQELMRQENSVELIVQGIQKKLSSPMSSYYSYFLEADPLLLLPETLLQLKNQRGYDLKEGVLLRENGALILLDIPTDFSRQEQHASVGHITKILAEVSEEFPSVESRWSGMLRFADSSASRMEAELNLLSILNIIIVISFLFYSFRSFRPFFLCLLAIASGMLGGAAAVVLWKQSIHILTLAFGGSLLGACVDYPLHYFCAAREKNKAHVILSITLGALTTAIAFLSLIFSGFEGLIEISVFSIGSVLFTWLTVYCVHSQIEVTFPKYETFGVICDAVSKFIQKFRYLLLAGLVLVFAFGFMRFSTDDDVRLLQPSSPVLIEAEKWIQEQSGQGIPSGMLFVKGESESQLNSRVREIASALGGLVESGALSAFESRHSVFPSLEDQRESAEIYQKFIDKNGAEIRRALSELGLEENLIEKVFVISEPQDFSFKHFDLEATKGYHWSFIPLYGLRDAALVAELISEKGFYYNATKEITEIFSGYRERSVFLVGLSYLCILLLFIFKYGPMTGVRCFTPAVCSALGGLFLLAALGLPISFFSILALIIVLGLTIDYSIFYLEGGYQRIPPSILISALTTMFSFGLLGTSSTPVLSHFGIVVASGVFFSLFLTHPRT